jgi:hypothetical protein
LASLCAPLLSSEFLLVIPISFYICWASHHHPWTFRLPLILWQKLKMFKGTVQHWPPPLLDADDVSGECYASWSQNDACDWRFCLIHSSVSSVFSCVRFSSFTCSLNKTCALERYDLNK